MRKRLSLKSPINDCPQPTCWTGRFVIKGRVSHSMRTPSLLLPALLTWLRAVLMHPRDQFRRLPHISVPSLRYIWEIVLWLGLFVSPSTIMYQHGSLSRFSRRRQYNPNPGPHPPPPSSSSGTLK
jgi:hypothetical protein